MESGAPGTFDGWRWATGGSTLRSTDRWSMEHGMETCTNCGATLSTDIDWCGRCLEPVARPPRPHLVLVPETPAPVAERLLFVLLVVVVGAAAYAALLPLVDRVGSPIWGIVTLFLGVYTIFGLVSLWVAWRPGRKVPVAEHEVVIRGEVIRVPDLPERAPRW